MSGLEANAEQVLLRATGQATKSEALAWLAEGYGILEGFSPQCVLSALLTEDTGDAVTSAAVRHICQLAADSDIDPTLVLFDVDRITTPATYRRCLDALAFRSPGRTIANANVDAVRWAMVDEPATMDTLALLAGLTPKELRRRLGDEAPSASGAWTSRQVAAAFNVIDAILAGIQSSPIKNSAAARPIEHLVCTGEVEGWALVEQMRTGGVSLELLLAQRAVGGSWGQHRNATSSSTGQAIAESICKLLGEASIPFKRGRRAGGDDDITELSPIGKFASVVTVSSSGDALWSLVISVANDSGTASKTSARLRSAIGRRDDVAVVLVGSGWVDRINDTVTLAQSVGGRIYTERHLDELVHDLTVSGHR